MNDKRGTARIAEQIVTNPPINMKCDMRRVEQQRNPGRAEIVFLTLFCALQPICAGGCSSKGPQCGNNKAEESEVCDGTDLRNRTCGNLGFEGGDLGCLDDCSGYDTSGCWTGTQNLTWVFIPGGSFEMGSAEGNKDELPVHTVNIPGFEMTKSHVTVAQYEECAVAGYCDEPSPGDYCNWNVSGHEDHPVNCVSWFQAVDFCAWAGARLPSESEWEYAARSGGMEIAYPWGNETATCEYAMMNDGGGFGCGTRRTGPVCSKPAGNTAHGLCDMAGNVEHWIQDWYRESYDCDAHPDVYGCEAGKSAPDDGSAWLEPGGSSIRVTRGGSFYSTAEFLRASLRTYFDPEYAYYFHGFRCARDLVQIAEAEP